MRIKLLTCTLPAIAALILGACGASKQAREVEIKNTMLFKPEILQHGGPGQALYRYASPGFDIRRYSAVLVEPVLIAKDGELSVQEKENYQKLANNAYLYLTEALQKEIRVVREPGKGTMVLQMAIRDVDASSRVRSITSTVLPIGLAINAAKYAATGKPSAVGEITAEFRVTDAETGELLLAALDRRVGGASLQGAWDTWHGADEALKFWARRAAYLLCQNRSGGNCVAP